MVFETFEVNTSAPGGCTSRRPVRVVHLVKIVGAGKTNETVEPSASDLEEAQQTPFGGDSRGSTTKYRCQIVLN